MPNGTIMNGPPHGPGQQCIEWSNGGGYKKGGRVRKKNKGGLLKGPSHAQGGIPARLKRGGEVELEGGEYIVNAQTVEAVGEQFLDQLNSTATTYHEGGYSRGQLPNPSRYKRGGKIMPRRVRRKRMARGGRARPVRKMAFGGRQTGQVRRRKMQIGGMEHPPGSPGPGAPPARGSSGPFGQSGPQKGGGSSFVPGGNGGNVNIGDCIRWNNNGQCIDVMY
tara:strand:+ start:1765 stop:2427 length:663 start_codon:yes stop_codon:yes gene_type:complete